MKKYILLALTAFCVFAGIISCETYKVEEPDMSAVSDFDGKWICFGVNEAGDTAVYFIEITNDTYDSADKLWFTVVNNDPYVMGDKYGLPAYNYYYLDGFRFKVDCNKSDLTFQCDSSETTAPYLVNNEYLGQTYYTVGYAFYGKNAVLGKALVTDGKIVKNAIATGGDQKASSISFVLTRVDDGAPKEVITMSGMKITGWAEDIKEYTTFMEDNYD